METRAQLFPECNSHPTCPLHPVLAVTLALTHLPRPTRHQHTKIPRIVQDDAEAVAQVKEALTGSPRIHLRIIYHNLSTLATRVCYRRRHYKAFKDIFKTYAACSSASSSCTEMPRVCLSAHSPIHNVHTSYAVHLHTHRMRCKRHFSSRRHRRVTALLPPGRRIPVHSNRHSPSHSHSPRLALTFARRKHIPRRFECVRQILQRLRHPVHPVGVESSAE